MTFDVIRQTLTCTTLGELRQGDKVNLEHAVRAGDLMGGHFVQGHIDGVGRVLQVDGEGQWRVRLAPPRPLLRWLTDKGSIAVDGVSLTIAAVGPEWFEVALIPTTLELTTLSRLQNGDKVNLEADMLAKLVTAQLDRSGLINARSTGSIH